MDAKMIREMAKWHEIIWNFTAEYTGTGGVLDGECISERKGNE